MADRVTVVGVVHEIADAYGRASTWADRVVRSWVKHLDEVDDDVLEQVVHYWVRHETSPPTVAELLRAIQGHQKRNGLAQYSLEGCPECGDSGTRDMARHFRQDGTYKVHVYVAACDCAKGQRLSAGLYTPWKVVGKAWREHPGTVEIYWTSAKHASLTLEEREPPAVVERLRANTASPRLSLIQAMAQPDQYANARHHQAEPA